MNGTIQESLYNLTELYYLDLSSNQFSGTISKEIGNLKKLEILYLSDNLFSGTLPTELGLCQELRKWKRCFLLYLTSFVHVFLMSTLETCFIQFFSEELSIYSNNMTGTIPESLYNLTELTGLDLSLNQFSGTISKEIGNWQKLEILLLYGNLFSGTLPTELGLCKELGKCKSRFLLYLTFFCLFISHERS